MPRSDKSPGRHPWERRNGESEEAYAAFLKYRDLGVNRSLDAVGISNDEGKQKSSKRGASGRIFRWSTDNDWVARCVAWDNHLQAERDKVAAAEARKWEKRRQASLEENWDVAQRLREKLNAMLKMPVSRTRSEDGRTIIEPARWSFQTAAMMAKMVAELEAAVLTAVWPDLDEMTDAEARAIADLDLPAELRLASGGED